MVDLIAFDVHSTITAFTGGTGQCADPPISPLLLGLAAISGGMDVFDVV